MSSQSNASSCQDQLLVIENPCSPLPPDDSLNWCRAPPPSPILNPQRICTPRETMSAQQGNFTKSQRNAISWTTCCSRGVTCNGFHPSGGQCLDGNSTCVWSGDAYGYSCPSPSYTMLTVDEQLVKHAKKLSKWPSPAQQAYMRRRTPSVDSSPLHQCILADADSTTLAALGSPSPTFSDPDTLHDQTLGTRINIPQAFASKGGESGNNMTWSKPTSEISPPTSPTLSESSLSSTTPLFPNRLSTTFHHNKASKPRTPINGCDISPPLSATSIDEVPTVPRVHGKRISLPIGSDSSIDARIRPSSISSINVAIVPNVSDSAPTSSPAKAHVAKSVPKHHHRAKAREFEGGRAVAVDPSSQFSDDEDEVAFRRLGRIFGKCFAGRKA